MNLRAALLKLAKDESEKHEQLRKYLGIEPEFEILDEVDDETIVFAISGAESIEGVPECIKKLNGEALVLAYMATFTFNRTKATRDEPADYWSDLEDEDVSVSVKDNAPLTAEDAKELEKFFTVEKLNKINPRFMSDMQERLEQSAGENYDYVGREEEYDDSYDD